LERRGVLNASLAPVSLERTGGKGKKARIRGGLSWVPLRRKKKALDRSCWDGQPARVLKSLIEDGGNTELMSASWQRKGVIERRKGQSMVLQKQKNSCVGGER